MIPTLKGNNGSFAGLGTIQIQPLSVESPEYQSQQQTGATQHGHAMGVLPTRQATLSMPVFLHNTGSVDHKQTTNLSDIAAMLASDPSFVFPFGPNVNKLAPSYRLSTNAARAHDPRDEQQHVTTTAQFQPYELATGISQERPEIVMLAGFLPLFAHGTGAFRSEFASALEASGFQGSQTDAGQFIEAQFLMRGLQVHDMQALATSLRKRYPGVDQMMKSRADAFAQGIKKLKEDTTFLLNAVRMLEHDKARLDVRHDAFLVKDPQEVARFIAKNFQQRGSTLGTSQTASSIVEALVSMGTRHSFDFHDCMHDLGYSQSHVRGTFCASKVWLQTAQELKLALEHHTLQLLDIDPIGQRHDSNPTAFVRPGTRYFGLAVSLPQLPSVDALVGLPVSGLSQAVSAVQAGFTNIYQNAYFKSEEARIAALAHVISREYRYSRGLTSPALQASLAKSYGYQVLPRGNRALFDSVVGTFGNNISDFPANDVKSLASVAQLRPEPDLGVLTFESKYVEGDTGTLTPGGDYFFDRVLSHVTARSFDTTGCDRLAQLADEQLAQFMVVVDGLNLLMLPSQADPRRAGSSRDDNTSFMGHPSDLVHQLTSRLVNVSSGKTLSTVASDRIGAIYARARTDGRLKTLLFLHTLNRISRVYGRTAGTTAANLHNDNTPLVDHLVEDVVKTLISSTPQTRSTVQLVGKGGPDNGLNTASLTPDSIKHAFKSGTVLTGVVEDFMIAVMARFNHPNGGMKEGYTLYSGYMDTVVMMMAFDLAIATIARYSSQQIVGMHNGLNSFSKGQITFAISRTSTSHAASLNDIVQRHNREGDLIRQMIVTFVNALLVTSATAHSTSNYFKSDVARSKLTDILRGLKGDVNMMRMLLSEQQIMMLAAGVNGLSAAHDTAAYGRPGRIPRPNLPGSVAEVPVLDGSEVPPEAQQALLGLLASPEYATRNANDKRIITVGIPLGFSQRLKQRVNLEGQKRTSFSQKQSDLVQIVVYKTDMQHTDVVYRPLRFIFELSRFPVKAGSSWLPVRDKPTISDIVHAIPTQNFEASAVGQTTLALDIEYASTAIADQQGVKNARAAFTDGSYSFMTTQQKAQVLHNHVVSQLLELYVKMMTGIDVDEQSFYMVEPSPMADVGLLGQLTQYSLARLAEQVQGQHSTPTSHQTGGVLFSTTSQRPVIKAPGSRGDKSQTRPILSNPAGTAGNVQDASQFRSSRQENPTVRTLEEQSAIQSADASLDVLSHRHVDQAITALRTVYRLANSLTSLTLPDTYRYRAMVPKQFDRVFTIMVDPSDFEIDVKATLATPYGRRALDLLIQHGEVEPVGSPMYLGQYGYRQWQTLVASTTVTGQHPVQGRFVPNVNNFRFRDRNKNNGDLLADKYFVTIETLEESDDT